MAVHPLAGQVAPYESLINVPRLISAYYTLQPDPANPLHQVAFGTSGHRGSSLNQSFNEAHILAISQAICEFRKAQGTSGPLYLGMDTHALPSRRCLRRWRCLLRMRWRYSSSRVPAIHPRRSFRTRSLAYNHGRTNGLADGVVITPRIIRREMAALNTIHLRRAGGYPGHEMDPGPRQRHPGRWSGRSAAHSL